MTFLLVLLAGLIHRLGHMRVRVMLWPRLSSIRFVPLDRLTAIVRLRVLDMGIQMFIRVTKQLCPRNTLSRVFQIRQAVLGLAECGRTTITEGKYRARKKRQQTLAREDSALSLQPGRCPGRPAPRSAARPGRGLWARPGKSPGSVLRVKASSVLGGREGKKRKVDPLIVGRVK